MLKKGKLVKTKELTPKKQLQLKREEIDNKIVLHTAVALVGGIFLAFLYNWHRSNFAVYVTNIITFCFYVAFAWSLFCLLWALLLKFNMEIPHVFGWTKPIQYFAKMCYGVFVSVSGFIIIPAVLPQINISNKYNLDTATRYLTVLGLLVIWYVAAIIYNVVKYRIYVNKFNKGEL